jgi:hypothetical protein
LLVGAEHFKFGTDPRSCRIPAPFPSTKSGQQESTSFAEQT